MMTHPTVVPMDRLDKARAYVHAVAEDVEYDYTPQRLASALREVEEAVREQYTELVFANNAQVRGAVQQMLFAWANYAGLDSAWVMHQHTWMENYAAKRWPSKSEANNVQP